MLTAAPSPAGRFRRPAQAELLAGRSQNCVVCPIPLSSPSVAKSGRDAGTWFRLNDHQRGKGEPLALIYSPAITRHINGGDYSIDPKRVYACPACRRAGAGLRGPAIIGQRTPTCTRPSAFFIIFRASPCRRAAPAIFHLRAPFCHAPGAGNEKKKTTKATGKAPDLMRPIVFPPHVRFANKTTRCTPEDVRKPRLYRAGPTKGEDSDDGGTSRSTTPRAMPIPARPLPRRLAPDFRASGAITSRWPAPRPGPGRAVAGPGPYKNKKHLSGWAERGAERCPLSAFFFFFVASLSLLMHFRSPG